jgi:hypothetical protein
MRRVGLEDPGQRVDGAGRRDAWKVRTQAAEGQGAASAALRLSTVRRKQAEVAV